MPRGYGKAVRPTRNDALLAAGAGALAVIDVVLNPGVHPTWAAAVTEIPVALMLAWRRRLPLATTVLVCVGFAAESVLGVPGNQPVMPLLSLVVALYTVAAHTPLRRAAAGFAVTVVAGGVLSAFNPGDAWAHLGNFLFGLVLTGATWAIGRVVRARTQRGDRLESERAGAVAEERGRIARELHDVVAHSVSVMVVQAGAAQEVLDREPVRAREALEAVQETGRQALVELSRLVGLLRDDHEELGLAPQPGIGALDALVAKVRDAGLPVDLRIEGEPRRVPLGVDLSAYRVIQEALTNALKHAGDARATVLLRYERDALELEVVDDGTAASNGAGGGHGLIGMRERVAVFGGELTAGPEPRRGFAVRVRLPLEGAA
jgi:signal transduction histidine kinase